jgi:uncharacterized protein (DUF1015 family)
MARIYPFRASRYNPSSVRMEDVVTQPYDKITPSMQQGYYQRSPYNLCRIILGLPELFDEPGVNDVYTRAARDFREWRRTGILQTEKEPCIFAYTQRFAVPGRPEEVRERRSFIALGGLQDYSDRVVFRHEQTLSKPKSDRLNLLRATRAHFGQIFMLYSDPALTIERILFGANFVPEIEVTDEYGVLHRLAKVSDPHTIRLIVGVMEDKKLIIADGHHRYETALNYAREHAPAKAHRQERDLATTLPRPLNAEAAVMMTFVNMDGEGLTILPTHRVVFGLPHFDAADFLERAKSFFTVEPVGNDDGPALLRKLAEAGAAHTAFIAVLARGCFLLTAKDEAIAQVLCDTPATAAVSAAGGTQDGIPDSAPALISERQRQLDVTQLHRVVLEDLLHLSEDSIREQRNLRYVRDVSEAKEQVTTGAAQVAFLMNPVTLDELREIAFNGEVMPQKSTDFYPKLLSGLAIYALD